MDVSKIDQQKYRDQISLKGKHFFRERFSQLPVGEHSLSLYKREVLRPDDVKNFMSSPFPPADLGEFGDDLTSKSTVAYAAQILDARAASRESHLMVRDVPITDAMRQNHPKSQGHREAVRAYLSVRVPAFAELPDDFDSRKLLGE